MATGDLIHVDTYMNTGTSLPEIPAVLSGQCHEFMGRCIQRDVGKRARCFCCFAYTTKASTHKTPHAAMPLCPLCPWVCACVVSRRGPRGHPRRRPAAAAARAVPLVSSRLVPSPVHSGCGGGCLHVGGGLYASMRVGIRLAKMRCWCLMHEIDEMVDEMLVLDTTGPRS
jgi:hypothetical protein